MQWSWGTVFGIQGLIVIIVLFEWKRLKKASKADIITFSAILLLSEMIAFFNLENVPGPLTLLQYIFGPLSILME